MNHSPKTPKALVIAAPATGSGKTTLTLGLLRALKRRGLRLAPAKIGPDYIDPRFHQAACGRPCVNLDGWAMRPGLLRQLAHQAAAGSDLLLAEGVMGLYDGGAEPGHLGRGSTADVARALGLKVVLVVDASGLGQSVAPLVQGFAGFDPSVEIGGLILNKVAGARHETMLREALAVVPVPILGAMPRVGQASLPSRHLGLVQAGEMHDLEAFIEASADRISDHVDLDALIEIGAGLSGAAPSPCRLLPPPGQRIALAEDVAFGFSYSHLLEGWRAMGAEISLFSPLNDEAPAEDADAVYLPGGYPELHAPLLAGNHLFLTGLSQAAARGAAVYGECGGFMVLGEGLVDASGARHKMAGLLALETSFAQRRLHLGYRRLVLGEDFAGLKTGQALRGHEFHYASTLSSGGDAPLFRLAGGDETTGLRRGSVAGSFMHLIDLDGDC